MFSHKLNWTKLFSHLKLNPKVIFNLIPFLRHEFYEEDFETKLTNKNIEEINMKNIFTKKKIKNVIKSWNIESCNNNYIEDNINSYKNKIKIFSNYSEKSKNYGVEYYNSFLQLFNNNSNDFLEDIEISIYDNLKEENNLRENNFTSILDMIDNCVSNEESKKGFLALLRQSFLLGKLRNYIVSNYFNISFIGEGIYFWNIW